MSKFTLICEHDTSEMIKNSYEFNSDFLPDVLMNIENFLRGCGFVFEGQLDIINEDAEDAEEVETEEKENSIYYYDLNRNK